MATYTLQIDNPKLYNQSGNVHGSSPLRLPKDARVEVIGASRFANDRTIYPLGDGTWLDAVDIRLATETPPTEPPPSSGDGIGLAITTNSEITELKVNGETWRKV